MSYDCPGKRLRIHGLSPEIEQRRTAWAEDTFYDNVEPTDPREFTPSMAFSFASRAVLGGGIGTLFGGCPSVHTVGKLMTEKVSKSAITDAFWKAFQDDNPQAPDEYHLLRFGGSNAALATELADLVVSGSKRATATLLRDFENGAEPVFPKPGQFWVLINGACDPLSVVRTTQVDIVAFGDVDAAFAWDEGEGDGSLASWRDAHLQYFGSQAAMQGFTFEEHSQVVLERFEVLWPNRASKLGQVG